MPCICAHVIHAAVWVVTNYRWSISSG